MEINKIYHEDCLNTIHNLKQSGKQVDLVITSPPYNMNLRISKGKYCFRGMSDKHTFSKKYKNFCDGMLIEDYYNFHKNIIKNLLEISDIMFYNISIVTGSKRAWFKIIGEFGDYLKDIVVWNKQHGEPAMLSGVLNRSYELILIFDSKNAISRKFDKFNFNRGELKDVWDIKKQKSITNLNKAVFPVKLVEMIIKNFSNANDLIYDPFSGTGTTCVISKQYGRQFIGSEICEELVKISEERLKCEKDTI